jgi:NADH:ubiquinone oxidoreductase subunit E
MGVRKAKAIEPKEMDLDEVVKLAVQHHGASREAVISILGEVNQAFGYIPTEALGKIRRLINSPEEGLFLADSHIYAIASFYQMFSLQPNGRHIIRFCESAPCHVVGALEVLEAIQRHLGIQIGETTEDGQWSLLPTSCLGVCGVGPVFLIDEDLYGNLTAENAAGILAKYH